MTRYFEPGSIHTLHLEAKNTTSRDWTYRFVIISGGNEIDEIVSEIAAGITKLLSVEVQMPEVSVPTEVKFQVHAYETSKGYDLGIVDEETVVVQSAASGNDYNASAYFDDNPQSSYAFEAGTEHKVTVIFTNPYDVPMEFYVANDVFNVFNQWGFFNVGAGQTVTKEASFLVSDTPQVVGPVNFIISCTESGIPDVIAGAGYLEIIENAAVQDGTIDVIPVESSVGQGRALDFDVVITNTTNKRWTYKYTAYIQDAGGVRSGGVTSTAGVGPYDQVTIRHRVSVIHNDMTYPDVGTAQIKTKFMDQTQVHGAINITSASEPGVTASLSSYRWTDMTQYMFQATIKNTAGVEKYFDVYAYIYDGVDLQTYNILGSLTLGAGQSGSVENQLMPYYVGAFDVKVKIVTYEPDSWIVNELKTFSAGTVTISG